MNPTSSFFGKCVTVLIGMALSWATMTNPQIEQLARQFFGQNQSQRSVMLGEEPFIEPSFGPVDNPLSPASVEVSPSTEQESSGGVSPSPSLRNFALEPIQPTQQSPTSLVSLSEAAPAASDSTLSSEDRIHLASQTLRDLGATYLRLEKLTNPDGECYRVRCDLAGETDRIKCSYEATRGTAVAAMEDVLRAVRDGVADDTRKVAARLR